jgi:hypothetical protein
MRHRLLIVASIAVLLVGCGRSQSARLNDFMAERHRYREQYVNGDALTAKHVLSDDLELIKKSEAGGLRGVKWEYMKSLTMTRLALVCQQLGDTKNADDYLHMAVISMKESAQKENRSLPPTDEQIQAGLILLVTKLDENAHPFPKWRAKPRS